MSLQEITVRRVIFLEDCGGGKGGLFGRWCGFLSRSGCLRSWCSGLLGVVNRALPILEGAEELSEPTSWGWLGIRPLGDRTVAGGQWDSESREGGRADGPSANCPKVRELNTEATKVNVEFREIVEGRELVFGAGGGFGCLGGRCG